MDSPFLCVLLAGESLPEALRIVKTDKPGLLVLSYVFDELRRALKGLRRSVRRYLPKKRRA